MNQTTEFGFNTNSNGNKNFFIKINNNNFQVNLEQIPLTDRKILGLITTIPPPRIGGGSGSLYDSNTKLIYSYNNSIRTQPFGIFDPVNRYGYSGYGNDESSKDAYYFIQDDQGNQIQIDLSSVPQSVKTLLNTGINNNINQSFTLPNDSRIIINKNEARDPRCPSPCNCTCTSEEKELRQSLYDIVKNNPDPKFPKGCAVDDNISCRCAQCTYRDKNTSPDSFIFPSINNSLIFPAVNNLLISPSVIDSLISPTVNNSFDYRILIGILVVILIVIIIISLNK
jgi:hypothetical protein